MIAVAIDHIKSCQAKALKIFQCIVVSKCDWNIYLRLKLIRIWPEIELSVSVYIIFVLTDRGLKQFYKE